MEISYNSAQAVSNMQVNQHRPFDIETGPDENNDASTHMLSNSFTRHLKEICAVSGVIAGATGAGVGISLLVNDMRSPSPLEINDMQNPFPQDINDMRSPFHQDITDMLSPSPQENILNDYYNTTSYNKVELESPHISIHIYGTQSVSDWMLNETQNMAIGILTAMNNAEDISKFDNHHIYVITNDDPDVPGAINNGHKNTGNAKYTIINQELICATAVDTLYPDLSPQWRAWDTPIHEFGHSIEFALGLEDFSNLVYSSSENYNSDFAREFFPWQTESWFNADLRFEGSSLEEKRSALPESQLKYFTEIFNINNNWQPSCSDKVGR